MLKIKYLNPFKDQRFADAFKMPVTLYFEPAVFIDVGTGIHSLPCLSS